MTVATRTQPDFATQSPSVVKAAIETIGMVDGRLAGAFAPHEQSTPNMTVRLDAGPILNGIALSEVVAQSTGTITAPGANPRIDRVVIDAVTGEVSVITGAEAASPVAPALTEDKLPCARVLLATSSTTITNSMITDERVMWWTQAERRNMLVNPNWQIDQIWEGSLNTVSGSDIRGPDGWSGTGIGAGIFRMRTLADPDNAALKCMEVSCTTADASLAASDDYFIYTAIEGYDVAGLKSGTAAAGKVSVKFRAKFPAAGTYGVFLANSAKNRSNYQVITVPDANENEYTLTFQLDATGTWLYTNGVGLYLGLCLGAGTNFQGTAGAWAADAKQTTSAQTNFMAVNTNIMYLKRIQLTPGAASPTFQPANIQQDLAKAQRYYLKTFPQGVAPVQNVGNVVGCLAGNPFGTTGKFAVNWRYAMRASPTITTYSPDLATANWSVVGGLTPTPSIENTSADGAAVIGVSSGGGANLHSIHATANARLS